MARIKDQHLHDERKRQILDAAAAIFQLKGFHAARTEEICAKAKLSSGSAFRYFKDKEEIIATIAEMEVKTSFDRLKQLVTPEGLLWLSRMKAADWNIIFSPSQFRLKADSWLELYRNKRYKKWIIEQDIAMRKVVSEALKKGQKEGWVRADLCVKGAASVLISLFSGLLFDYQVNPELDWKSKAEATADLIRTFVLREGAK